MTTFVSEQAFLENKLKNLRNSLRHFNKRLKHFNAETVDDLRHEKSQIIQHYRFLISHIQSEIENTEKDLDVLR